MAYRKNVTDKQQADIERAVACSAIRFPWFDGKQIQTGQTKSIRAYEVPPTGNVGSETTSAQRQFSGSGLCIGSHNDKPAKFDTPGKA